MVVPDGKLDQTSSVSWPSVEAQIPFLRVSSQFSIPDPTITMRVSGDGRGNWQTLNSGIPTFIAIGKFDDAPGAEIVIGSHWFWEVLSGGRGRPVRQSPGYEVVRTGPARSRAVALPQKPRLFVE